MKRHIWALARARSRALARATSRALARAASRAVIAGLLLLLVCGGSLGALQRARKPATHTVTIDATRFQPESLTIKAGDTVLWVNKDVIPHTATSQERGFDSGTIASGASWKRTFTKKGDVAYICTFHPTMKAQLSVE
jgi:plastocyanin